MRKLLKSSACFRIGALAALWLVSISVLHLSLNGESRTKNRILMGYMPVITNLAAPLVDYATRDDDLHFEAMKFSSFTEMAETFRSGHIQAAFIIAPLAIMLSEQGVPLRIVYIGNRHESTMVVRANGQFNSAMDLVGKKIAVPLRYSGHYLALKRYMRNQGLHDSSVNIVEIPPPEMPSALAASEIDGYFVGEPFASKAIHSGVGKRFLDAESIWPDFICNLLIVREELIKSHPEWVEKLVQTAARSGIWAGDHVDEAIGIVAKYWGQDPDFIRYVFTHPPGRFRFDLYTPVIGEMNEMAAEMRREGFLPAVSSGGPLIDDRFAKGISDLTNSSKDIFTRLGQEKELREQATRQ
ncbi:MAG: ABC transporter substrate-binding protein [Syntrophobacter sp.]